nr:MAG TPA: Transcriptional regulator, TetR family.1, Putative TetR Transcriptional Regulator [Bacteriophage sp.]
MLLGLLNSNNKLFWLLFFLLRYKTIYIFYYFKDKDEYFLFLLSNMWINLVCSLFY